MSLHCAPARLKNCLFSLQIRGEIQKKRIFIMASPKSENMLTEVGLPDLYANTHSQDWATA